MKKPGKIENEGKNVYLAGFELATLNFKSRYFTARLQGFL